MGVTVVVIFVVISFDGCVSADAVFENHQSNGRSLLQAKKTCTVDFESKNYTILTSQCKGPRYTAEACCKAFKEFACPFADEINDQSTNCADTMFSYMNLYGSYPPGTFANLCKEGKNGLECSEDGSPANSNSNSKKNGAYSVNAQSPIAVILISSLVFLS